MAEREPGKVIQITHPAGLCGGCRHVQVITSDRGSRFYLCRLSATDSRFRRYPVIPVRECAGFSPAEPER
jgi:hypothetical protein